MPVDKAAVIARNVRQVRESIAAAAIAANRTPGSVRLVAITKYVSVAITRWVVEAGCHDLGESRPQQLWEKSAALFDLAPRWHLIGHLQRNKLARTMPLVHLIHSIDSLRLLTALQDWAQEHQLTLLGLLEINISGDANKTGLAPAALPEIVETAARSPHVDIRGLMGMAHGEGDPAQARRDFAALRSLHEHWRGQGVIGEELSMGMSGDYVEAHPGRIDDGPHRLRALHWTGSMNQLQWEPHAEGLVIAVRALPGARRNAIRGLQNGALKVAVTQIAEDGKANHALRNVLADALHLRRSQIELLCGLTNPQKKFLLRDVTVSQLTLQLQAYDVVLADRIG